MTIYCECHSPHGKDCFILWLLLKNVVGCLTVYCKKYLVSQVQGGRRGWEEWKCFIQGFRGDGTPLGEENNCLRWRKLSDPIADSHGQQHHVSSDNVHGSQVTEKDGSCNRVLRGGRKSGYTGSEIERQNCYYTTDTVQVTVTREFTHRLFSLIPRPSHHPIFDFWILSKTGHGAIKN